MKCVILENELNCSELKKSRKEAAIYLLDRQVQPKFGYRLLFPEMFNANHKSKESRRIGLYIASEHTPLVDGDS